MAVTIFIFIINKPTMCAYEYMQYAYTHALFAHSVRIYNKCYCVSYAQHYSRIGLTWLRCPITPRYVEPMDEMRKCVMVYPRTTVCACEAFLHVTHWGDTAVRFPWRVCIGYVRYHALDRNDPKNRRNAVPNSGNDNIVIFHIKLQLKPDYPDGFLNDSQRTLPSSTYSYAMANSLCYRKRKCLLIYDSQYYVF